MRLPLESSWARPFVTPRINNSLDWANSGPEWCLLGVRGRLRGMNHPDEKLTTAQAAKLLGVRTDTVHVMKAEGHLTVVGRGRHGTNLFALADVELLKAQRLKAHRAVPAQQAELPGENELACDGCRSLRAQLLAEREGRLEAEARVQAERDRATRALTGLNAIVG
ncbi:hypothetical protein GA0115241_108544 [Streptomyces sp. DpondAA-D4]|nr:hypothetical protein YUMDRAFT_03901 [Streptomyces sp. OspMP-M45]SCD94526.1 hypothetical protein GA0115241_108544 [Streptomyces sp. DpondAA-D4]SCE17823.1 hypothetical protein GA0115249_114613 [Streptomyces sp. PpalLS-921]